MVQERPKSDTLTSLRSVEPDRRRPTNPYDADGWTGEVDIIPLQPITINTGTSTRFLTQDANRLWFLVAIAPDTQDYTIWPQQQTAFYGIKPHTSESAILIHNASYPGLVQGDWYYLHFGLGVTLHVIVARTINNGRL